MASDQITVTVHVNVELDGRPITEVLAAPAQVETLVGGVRDGLHIHVKLDSRVLARAVAQEIARQTRLPSLDDWYLRVQGSHGGRTDEEEGELERSVARMTERNQHAIERHQARANEALGGGAAPGDVPDLPNGLYWVGDGTPQGGSAGRTLLERPGWHAFVPLRLAEKAPESPVESSDALTPAEAERFRAALRDPLDSGE